MYRLQKKFFDTSSRLISRLFHTIFYRAGRYDLTWMDTWWMGTRVYKSPLDMWIYQEILAAKRPDLLIEAGTADGGSALYFAHIMDILGHGEIVTIDPVRKAVPQHSRITYLSGSSIDLDILADVAMRAAGHTTMVILDSDHSAAHVLAELRAYQDIVSEGHYLVVEDSNINGHPVHKSFGPGPWEALRIFMRECDSFTVDRERDTKYLFSFNPCGYLLKVRPSFGDTSCEG